MNHAQPSVAGSLPASSTTRKSSRSPSRSVRKQPSATEPTWAGSEPTTVSSATPITIRRYRDHARRLANTRNLERSGWLRLRRRGIGSSDAAAAVGLNPYQSALALWLEKTGRDVPRPEPGPEERLSDPMHWGQVLEPIVAEHYARHTGHQVRRVNAILQNLKYPWMLANLDREILGNDAVQILECKTTGINGARLWKDGVPESVQLQVMHQLAVTGQQGADVAVLIGGQQLEIHRITRDETLIEQLIAQERTFWEFVIQDKPPPADGSESAGRALRTLFAKDNGKTLDFSQHPGLNQTFAALKQVRQRLDVLTQEEARYKQALQQAMGEATRATFNAGSLSWKRSAPSRRLDTQALQRDHPALTARYMNTVAGSRRFLVRS